MNRLRLTLIIGTACSIGAATAVGFVGLVVPHILRPLVGVRPSRLLWASALGGAVMILAGEFVGLIGPNGAGKTTLMRAALGLIPASGKSNLAELNASERTRKAAWMPQAREQARVLIARMLAQDTPLFVVFRQIVWIAWP